MTVREAFYPVLGSKISKGSYGKIDLSISNHELKSYPVDTPAGMTDYINDFKNKNQILVPYGGYGEKRSLYTKSPLFNQDERNIHLGIDLWMPANTPLYTGMDAIVHSFANNDNFLDYGATIILQYRTANDFFYVLYGHLSLKSIKNLTPGLQIKKGENFAWIGDYNENGNWAPHLHLQKINTIGDHKGDYPGVTSEKESGFYLNNCPTPETLIFS